FSRDWSSDVCSSDLVDKVITAIKKGVRFGRYVPGQRLIENDLATTFQVSRGTVRDALRRLEAEGLVHFERYRGASIRKMSRRDRSEERRVGKECGAR